MTLGGLKENNKGHEYFLLLMHSLSFAKLALPPL